ncbi:MAG: hypothetical protein IPL22_19005 [Bacteroidetes bacterium]|nr:hypothetical protein [Bacteroidota bacterium]
MDVSKNILNIAQIAKDPKWSEVVKLYSGLFDDEIEKYDFIINTSEMDLMLAAEYVAKIQFQK